MKKKEFVKFIKFGFFSISAGLVEIISFTLMNELCRFNYWISYLIALVLSVLWNFTLNRKFTFKDTSNIPIAMFKVFVYYLIFTPLSTYLGNLLVLKGVNEYIVTALNMIINFITEFLYQRYYVFKKGKANN